MTTEQWKKDQAEDQTIREVIKAITSRHQLKEGKNAICTT